MSRTTGYHTVRSGNAETTSGVNSRTEVHWLVGHQEPQKMLPCLRCGTMILTDAAHRFCRRCRANHGGEFSPRRHKVAKLYGGGQTI